MNKSIPASPAKSIYFQAVEIDETAKRWQFVVDACQGDRALQDAVQRLLDADPNAADNAFDRAAEHLHPSLGGISEPAETASLAQAIADGTSRPVIDRYKLLEEIGRGGMGTVYMAQQTEPVKRRVALKVINPGMDSREVIARFEAERQALAMMDHPNIARVFDGGTTAEGRPYFVMELVRGVPITEYCDRHDLALDDRLRLFIDVCRAVQHAHQKGIIHRDIKPSNVLITEHGEMPVVKIIDFGVAKALHQELTDKTVFTRFCHLVGTPLYMSPEQTQLSGLDVDTRSDVYSLGVLLYELLTGTTPFDRQALSSAGIDGARRIICEEEPLRPSIRLSTIRASLQSTASDQGHEQSEWRVEPRVLRRELDWVVMKAIEKDRTRRYESASALANDIERYLSNEMLVACPPSIGYRVSKYVQRNKAKVLSGITAIALLIALATTTVYGQIQQAQVRQAIREKMASASAFMKAGDYETAQTELDQAETELSARNLADKQLRAQLAEQRRTLDAKLQAQIQYQKFQGQRNAALRWASSPGFSRQQIELLQDALEHYRILDGTLLEENPHYLNLDASLQRRLREELAESLYVYAESKLLQTSNLEANMAANRQAIDLLSRIQDLNGPTRGVLLCIARCWRSLGEDNLAAETEERAHAVKPSTALDYYILASEFHDSALESLDHYLRALDLNPRHYPSFSSAGWIYCGLDEFTAAEAMATGAIAIHPEHPDNYALRGVARLCQRKFELAELDFKARAARSGGKADGYYATYLASVGSRAQALSIYDKTLQENSGTWTRTRRAELYQNLGDHAKAIRDYSDFIRQLEHELKEKLASNRSTHLRHQIALVRVERALVYADTQQLELAQQDIELAIGYEDHTPASHSALSWFFATCPAPSLRDPQQARLFAEKAVEVVRQSGKLNTPAGGQYWLVLGAAQYRDGKWQSAVHSFEQAKRLDRFQLDLPVYGNYLAMCHWQLGHKEEARHWCEQSQRATNWRVNDWSGRHTSDWQVEDLKEEAAGLVSQVDLKNESEPATKAAPEEK